MIGLLFGPGALQQSYTAAWNWISSGNATRLLRFLHVASLGGTAILGQSQAEQEAIFEARCEGLSDRIDLENVTVNFVHYVPTGSRLSLGDIPAACGAESQAVAADACRLNMVVTTSNTSEIMLEAWLPRDYKGRFLSAGNSGLSGCT